MADIWAGKEASIKYEANKMNIRSPYDPNFVSDLKASTSSRKWNLDTKEWVVDISERDKALEVIRRYFLVLEENKPTDNVDAKVIQPLNTNPAFQVQDGDNLEIWTDGACANNPGPGGYAALLKNNDQINELTGGYSLTTNSRMEIMGSIIALASLNKRCSVTIYSDSRYVVDAMTLGWAKSWRAKGWKKSNKEKAANVDLWQRLLELCAQYDVKFVWVKGHSDNSGNKRCDEIAELTARMPNLPEDKGYLNEFK